ncbi:MAG: hypothetical protein M3388_17405 [Acidobacteriota bacterium]|nr:hypothetical protein [Acidobacteriota bacterium]
MLPKTTDEIANGGVYVQRVRCGKANCKCARGETHTGYYFFTRQHGKLIKQYIRKAEVQAFTEIVNQSRELKAEKRISTKQSNELLKCLRESSREYEQIAKLYRENYINDRSKKADKNKR